MKRIFLSATFSLVAYLALAWYLYSKSMQTCVGCGIAPDGVTNLGPGFVEYAVSMSPLFAVMLVGVYVIAAVFAWTRGR
jgi:hypothetical protein